MARQAVKAKDVRTEEQTEKVSRRRRARDRVTAFSGKTFEQLSKGEKEKLLKTVAIRLGLIQDSEEPS